MTNTENKIMEVIVKMNVTEGEAEVINYGDEKFMDKVPVAADIAGDEFWKIVQPMRYADVVSIVGKLYNYANSDEPVNALHLLESLFLVTRMTTACKVINDVMLYGEEWKEPCYEFMKYFFANENVQNYCRTYRNEIEED
ncbi:MAG: hypothetical protein Q4D99_04345 [Bacillota bacterium]|nr:hypothetical protein [Bacillota bacterium]